MLRSRTVLVLTAASAVVAATTSVVPSSVAAPAPRLAPAAPAAAEVWQAVAERPLASRDGLRQRVAPSSYAGYHLDLDALSQRLERAPLETDAAEPLLVSVPAPTGELVEFAVAESPVVEEGLAATHPDITTYAGRATGDSVASIRLDVTPMGFHASVRGAGGAWYVDPAYNGPDQGADALYLSYLGSDLPAGERRLVEPEVPEAEAAARAGAERVGEGGERWRSSAPTASRW